MSIYCNRCGERFASAKQVVDHHATEHYFGDPVASAVEPGSMDLRPDPDLVADGGRDVVEAESYSEIVDARVREVTEQLDNFDEDIALAAARTKAALDYAARHGKEAESIGAATGIVLKSALDAGIPRHVILEGIKETLDDFEESSDFDVMTDGGRAPPKRKKSESQTELLPAVISALANRVGKVETQVERQQEGVNKAIALAKELEERVEEIEEDLGGSP